MDGGSRSASFLSVEVAEQPLPGIGQRYQMRALEGGRISIVIHHSGRRDLDVLPLSGDGDPQASLTLTDTEARTLGAILAGAYFKPAVSEEMEAVIGGLLIDWVTLREGSPGVGRSIADLQVRQRTRMTIAAIMRDGEALVTPEPTEILAAGDKLVVLGRPENMAQFEGLVVG